MLFTPSRRHTGFDLFDDFFNDPFFTAPVSQPMNTIMRTDVKDDGSNYLLDIELPGFKKEDIRAELKDGYLTISASRQDNKDEKDKNGKVIRAHAFTSHLFNGHGKTPKVKRHARGTTVTDKTNTAAVKRMLPYK